MSTVGKIAVNPAKGNLQGQTTVAAKVDRWQGLNNNFAPQVDQMPQFKDQFARFQTVLARAQALRDRLKVIQGDFNLAMQERNELFGEGDELFTRLRLALKAVHGPKSGRLRDFGIKPLKTGRPRKTAPQTTTATPATSTATPAGGASEAHGATAAPTEK
jgi:hypothetical protein